MLREHLDKARGSMHATSKLSHNVKTDVIDAKLKETVVLRYRLYDLSNFYIILRLLLCSVSLELLRRGRINAQLG